MNYFMTYIYIYVALTLSKEIKAVGVDGGRVTSPLPYITTHKTLAFHKSIGAR